MDNNIFNDCLKHYQNNFTIGETWQTLAERFGYPSAESLRSSFKRERRKRGIPGKENHETDYETLKENYRETEEIRSDGTRISDRLIEICEMDKDNPAVLLKAHGFNPDQFELVSAKNNFWHMMKKGGERLRLYQSKITVKPRKGEWSEDTINKIFDNLKIKDFLPQMVVPKIHEENGKSLIIPFSDLHYGLLATDYSTGNEYSPKIAEDLVLKTVEKIKFKIKDEKFDEVCLILGNDMLNFDNIYGTTTKGTQQDNADLWYDTISKTTEFIITLILKLSEISKLRVYGVHGNHDAHSFFSIMKSVGYYFKDNPYVWIDTSPLPRKYYHFGKSVFGLSHDMVIKRALEIMTTEAKEFWSECNRFYWILGHLHTGMVYEKQGHLEIYRLPTISGWSRWTTESGFVQTEKKTQCFVVDKENGISDIWNIVV